MTPPEPKKPMSEWDKGFRIGIIISLIATPFVVSWIRAIIELVSKP